MSSRRHRPECPVPWAGSRGSSRVHLAGCAPRTSVTAWLISSDPAHPLSDPAHPLLDPAHPLSDPAVAVDAMLAPTLPVGWLRRSLSDGQEFYWNALSGMTQWEHPHTSFLTGVADRLKSAIKAYEAGRPRQAFAPSAAPAAAPPARPELREDGRSVRNGSSSVRISMGSRSRKNSRK